MRLFPLFFIFHFRALLTNEMKKKHAHINGGGCNKLATCSLSSSFCLENVQFFFQFASARARHTCAFIPTCVKTWPTPRSSHTPQTMLAAQAHLVPLFCLSLLPPSSFLSCIGWRHGSHGCLAQRSHRDRGAPPGGRRGQGREGRGKRLRD